MTKRSKIVSNKKMSFWEKIYLPAILKGMWITLGHLFTKKTTVRYPEVKREFSKIYRGKHVLKRDAQTQFRSREGLMEHRVDNDPYEDDNRRMAQARELDTVACSS